MSPEQARGNTKNVTTAVDVYGLGAILYETLTGSPPFGGDTSMETIRQVLYQEPRRPSIFNSTVDQDLETICLKSLEKEPSRRYGSATALADDLENWAAGKPVIARPITARQRFWRLCRRNPVPTAFAGIALLLLVVVAITSTISAVRISAVRRALRHNLYVAEMNIAFQDFMAGHVERARALLERQVPHRAEEELRGFEWRYLWGLTRPEEHSVLGDDNRSIWGMKFSPDNRLIAAGMLNGSVVLWDASTKEELATLKGHHAVVDTVAFSPDGRMLASCSRDRTICLWHVASHEPLRTFRHRQQTFWVGFTKDGKVLVSTASTPYASSPGEVTLWDVATGEQLSHLTGAESWICRGALSRDGNLLAVAAGNGSVLVWNLESKELLKRWRAHIGFAVSVQFSPDGKLIASCGEDGIVRLWQWDTSEPRDVAAFIGHEGTVFDLTISPDGKFLASGGVDHTAKLWDIESKHLLQTFRGHSARILCIDFTSDGQKFGTGSPDGTVRLWPVRADPEDKALMEHMGGWAQAWFSPDSAIIGHAAHRKITFFNTETKREVARLDGQSATFSPDSKLLAVLKSNVVDLLHPGNLGPIDSIPGGQPLRPPMTFSPDSQFLLVPCKKEGAVVFDVQSRRPIGSVQGGFADGYHLPTGQFAFSADGNWLFTTDANNGDIRLLDFPTLKSAGVLEGHSKPVFALATDRGFLLASGGDDATVRLWDWRKRSLLAALRPEAGWVWSVAFSPDGKTLACGTLDGSLVLWNVVTRQQITRLKAHSNALYFVVFSADGRHLATTSFDGTTRLWSARLLTEIAEKQ